MCPNPQNPSKVITRLIHSLKLSRKQQQTGGIANTKVDCSVKRSLVKAENSAVIPEELVGPPSLIQLKVNRHPCIALLDSGYVVIELEYPEAVTKLWLLLL